jgi:hypothetical protein
LSLYSSDKKRGFDMHEEYGDSESLFVSQQPRNKRARAISLISPTTRYGPWSQARETNHGGVPGGQH